MRNRSYYPEIGSVSTGTLRNEDLIPAFVDVLSDVIERSTFAPGADALENVANVGRLQDELGALERRIEADDNGSYFDTDDAVYDLNWLIDELQGFAPPFCTFGAHEGDGADYGYWPYMPDPDEVPGGTETPEGPTDSGFFLTVSDHGNVELYEWRGNAWRSVWGIV